MNKKNILHNSDKSRHNLNYPNAFSGTSKLKIITQIVIQIVIIY